LSKKECNIKAAPQVIRQGLREDECDGNEASPQVKQQHSKEEYKHDESLSHLKRQCLGKL